MFSRAPLLFLALALGTGCSVNRPAIGQTAEIGPTREPVLAAEDTREVITKQAPDALIARDGSSCRVAPEVYASTRVGSLFRCRWLRN